MKTLLKTAGAALVGAVFAVAMLIAMHPPRGAYDSRPSVSFVSEARAQVGKLWSAMMADPANAAAPGTPGIMSGADATKLDALPDNATLATQITTAVNAKVFPVGNWAMAGAPATTSARYMPNLANAAPASAGTGYGYHLAALAMTCTSITASYHNAVQATDNLAFTLAIDGVDSALTTTLTPGVPMSTGVHAGIAVTQGQAMTIKVVQSGSAASTAGMQARVSIGCKS